MPKLKKTVQQMVEEARQVIVNHTPEEAKRRVDEENALLVDSVTSGNYNVRG